MKKFAFQAIALVIVIAGALFFFISGTQLTSLPFIPQAPTSRQLLINNARLKVEIADTPDKRSKGLSGRQALASDEGMLFVFPAAGTYPFWMKGLSFPLDFVWIKGDKVIAALPNVQPPAVGQSDASLPIYQSQEPIDKVLELQAGTIQRLNIKAGDTIKIE